MCTLNSSILGCFGDFGGIGFIALMFSLIRPKNVKINSAKTCRYNYKDGFTGTTYTGWSKKVSHYQIIKTLCKVVLKSTNEINFFVKLKR